MIVRESFLEVFALGGIKGIRKKKTEGKILKEKHQGRNKEDDVRKEK